MIRSIVLDMGMVLMDYHPLTACRAVAPDEEAAFKLNTALFGHPDWARLDEGTLSMEELSQNAQARLTGTQLEPFIQKLIDGIPENIITPIPGMDEVTAGLLSAGYHLYLLSNASLVVSRRRELVPNLERFHGVMFSAEERLMKPDPAIYHLLIARYGLKATECLFIDDNEENVQAARRLGWQGYRYTGDVAALRDMLGGLNRVDAPGRQESIR
ncbi:MAG: HAD family phosphatase [Eubacteriales bacterium]|nr:HAD family phosphatase [Eubacteriales bacterium]